MRAHTRLVAPVMTLLVVTACATPRHRPTAEAPWAQSSQSHTVHALVEVANHNWSDAVVYLISDGFRARLGDVTSMHRKRFQVGVDAIKAVDVRLHVRFIGSSGDYTTGRVDLGPGQRMTLQLENYLPQSAYWIGR